MSPASYLTAPPRVAAASVPKAHRYDDSVPWWTIVALAVFGGVALSSGVVLLLVAVRTARTAADARRLLAGATTGLMVDLEEMQERLARVQERRSRLERSVDALERSQRKVDVLLWALRDVRTVFTRARGAVPRK